VKGSKTASYIPLLQRLSGYTQKDFRVDLMAGLTVGIMLVPQGMAYAYLAGMPPVYGLYGGLIPLVLYALFGTSRQLSIGPVAISAILVMAGVSTIAEPGTAEYVSLVLMAGLLIGIFELTLSLFRMGFLVHFLSHPVVSGFTSAAGVIIALSQLRDLLGISMPRFTHPYETLMYAIEHVGEANLLAVGVCITSMLIMLALKKLPKRIPGALVVVGLATLCCYLFDWGSMGLAVIGEVPNGLPAISVTFLTIEHIRQLLPIVLTVGLIGVVESMSIAKVLETKQQARDLRPNQELFAMGIAKVVGAFFQAMPTSGSFTRSAINHEAGARTGIASLITASLMGLTLLFLTPLFFFLPKAVLAAIILLAVRNLFDWKEAVHLYRTHRRDFYILLATFCGTLIFGIEEGVIIGVVLSIVMLLYRSARPEIDELGQIPETSHFVDPQSYRYAVMPEAYMVLRLNDQLYFGNASYFSEQVIHAIQKRKVLPKSLILDGSNMHDLDSTGAQALNEMANSLSRKGISLYMAALSPSVFQQLKRSHILPLLAGQQAFMTVGAVLMHMEAGEGTNIPETFVGRSELKDESLLAKRISRQIRKLGVMVRS